MTTTYSTEDWQELRELKLLLRALADEARLRIIQHLAGPAEVNVTELTQALESSQPLVSWRLAVLRKAGLVNTRPTGRQVYCSLNRKTLARCHELLYQLTGSSDTPGTETSGPVGIPLEQRKTRSCKLSPCRSSTSIQVSIKIGRKLRD